MPISLFLWGCGLSEESLDDAVTDIFVVSLTTQSDGERAAALAGKDVEGAEILEALAALWTGTLDIEGTGSATAKETDFDLATTFEEIQVEGSDLILDGDLDLTWFITYQSGSYQMEMTYDGKLHVSGADKGKVKMDFAIIIDSGENLYDFDGEINGNDAGDFVPQFRAAGWVILEALGVELD